MLRKEGVGKEWKWIEGRKREEKDATYNSRPPNALAADMEFV